MCLFHVFAQPQIGTAPGRYKHCAKAKLEPRKERQEIPRGGKLMKGQGLSRRPTWMRGTIG